MSRVNWNADQFRLGDNVYVESNVSWLEEGGVDSLGPRSGYGKIDMIKGGDIRVRSHDGTWGAWVYSTPYDRGADVIRKEAPPADRA